MAFYVTDDGELLTFRIKQPMQLELSNGVILPDPPPNGRMFAVERSAQKYADLLKELGNRDEATKVHLAWIRQGAP